MTVKEFWPLCAVSPLIPCRLSRVWITGSMLTKKQTHCLMNISTLISGNLQMTWVLDFILLYPTLKAGAKAASKTCM